MWDVKIQKIKKKESYYLGFVVILLIYLLNQ